MRTYRIGATMGPLLAWNAMAGTAIAVLFALAPEERPDDRWILYAVAGLLILLGPAALLAYLVRYFMVRVAIGATGLMISNRHEIPWADIREVELRGWRPGPWNPFKRLEMSGCTWVLVIVLFKVVLALLLVVVVLCFLRWALLPVAVLYSPWHSRVVIELTDGTRLVYRDLVDAEEFVFVLSQQIGQTPPLEAA